MAAIVVIPARYGSTRFPGKIVACDTGRPLVQHVVDQVKKCRHVADVIVATDDGRIAEALRPFETRVVMTSAAHQSGTDRVAEVARGLECEIVVNVQGDEPEIEPGVVDGLVRHLEGSADEMATAASEFPRGADVADPNLVKVVCDLEGRALWFSRAVTPFRREADFSGNTAYYLHLGIYAYRREFLMQFASWPATPLEKTERLEQLRVLEHGRSIFVFKTDGAINGIDTPEQYAAFVRRFKGVK